MTAIDRFHCMGFEFVIMFTRIRYVIKTLHDHKETSKESYYYYCVNTTIYIATMECLSYRVANYFVMYTDTERYTFPLCLDWYRISCYTLDQVSPWISVIESKVHSYYSSQAQKAHNGYVCLLWVYNRLECYWLIYMYVYIAMATGNNFILIFVIW